MCVWVCVVCVCVRVCALDLRNFSKPDFIGLILSELTFTQQAGNGHTAELQHLSSPTLHPQPHPPPSAPPSTLSPTLRPQPHPLPAPSPPGPLNIALMVPEVSACSRRMTNSCPSLEMSFTYMASGPSQPPNVGDLFSAGLVEASAIAPHLCAIELGISYQT